MTDQENFPMYCVRYLATKQCTCQHNGPEVERNSHWPSCIVGQAQEYMGLRVSWEINGKPVERRKK